MLLKPGNLLSQGGGEVTAPPSGPVPTISVAPNNVAIPVAGEKVTLDLGTWNDSPTSHSVNVMMDGLLVTTINSAPYEYTFIRSEQGKVFSTVVTAINGNGSSTPANSNSITILGDAVYHVDPSDTDPANIVNVGGAVSQLTDRSANTGINHLVENMGARQPTTGAGTIPVVAGKNIIRFNGTPHRLGTSQNAINAFDSEDFLHIFVGRVRDVSALNQRLFGQMSTGAGSTRAYIGTDGSNLWIARHSTTTGITSAVTADTDPHIFFLRRTGGTLELGLDGTVIASGGCNTIASNLATAYGNRGDTSNTGNSPFDLGQAVVLAGTYSNAQVNSIGAPLASKWGLSWAGLP